MSLPMAAVGPLNVLMKPILTVFSWAAAGPASQRERGCGGNACLDHCVSSLRLARSTALSIFADGFSVSPKSPDFALGQSC